MRSWRARERIVAVARILALAWVVAGAVAAAEVLEEFDDNGQRLVRREVLDDTADEPVNHGAYQSWWPSGKKRSEGSYDHGKRSGEWVFRWPSGKRRSQGEFVDDREQGKWITWYEDAGRESQGRYRDGVRHGKWTFWTRNKQEDPKRSGTYALAEVMDGPRVWCRGATHNGNKAGVWTYFWPNGAVQFEGNYTRGVMEGPWRLFHVDGSFEGAWISGTYSRGRSTGALDDAPGDGHGNPPSPWPLTDDLFDATPESTAHVDAFLDGDSGAGTALVALGESALPAVLNRLARCDLSIEADAENAGALYREICLPISSESAWPWATAGEDAESVNRRTILRWLTVWALLEDDPPVCAVNFGADFRAGPLEFRHSVFDDPPVPGYLWEPVPRKSKDQRPELFGGGMGGKFGRRFGRKTADKVVTPALDWLAAHQSDDGRWSSTRFPEECANASRSKPCDGLGAPGFDVATTAWALLAMLGYGTTPLQGDHAANVLRGAIWLARQQDARTGLFVDADHPAGMYQHALATEAMCEASYFSGVPAIDQAVGRAVAALEDAQLEEGGWSTDLGLSPADVSTTHHAVMALLTAYGSDRSAIDKDGPKRGTQWLITCVEASDIGRVSGHSEFVPADDLIRAAQAHLAIVFGTRSGPSPSLKSAASRFSALAPTTKVGELGADPTYLLYGSHVVFQLGGSIWKPWIELDTVARKLQRKKGHATGSWNPGQWTQAGGRVQSTAQMALAAEVTSRFGRMFGAR